MGYKDKEQQREYQRQWIAKRRADFFEGKVCVNCGSSENLELDHIDASQKVHHAIWSWSEARREAEIAKCQILCNPCHHEKTTTNAERGGKLTVDDIREIRWMLSHNLTQTEVAPLFNISRQTINGIATGVNWSWVD